METQSISVYFDISINNRDKIRNLIILLQDIVVINTELHDPRLNTPSQHQTGWNQFIQKLVWTSLYNKKKRLELPLQARTGGGGVEGGGRPPMSGGACSQTLLSQHCAHHPPPPAN